MRVEVGGRDRVQVGQGCVVRGVGLGRPSLGLGIQLGLFFGPALGFDFLFTRDCGADGGVRLEPD